MKTTRVRRGERSGLRICGRAAKASKSEAPTEEQTIHRQTKIASDLEKGTISSVCYGTRIAIIRSRREPSLAHLAEYEDYERKWQVPTRNCELEDVVVLSLALPA